MEEVEETEEQHQQKPHEQLFFSPVTAPDTAIKNAPSTI